MATASVASLGCWAALEISQAAVPRSPMSAAMAPAPSSVATTMRPETGRAIPSVRRSEAWPDIGRDRRGGRHAGTGSPIGGARSDDAVGTWPSRDGRCAAITTVRPTIRRRTADKTLLFGSAVETCRGFVEEQQRGVADEGPGQGHPLALARR